MPNVVVPLPEIRLVPFDEITVDTQPRYLVKGILPRVGLAVVWGAPKTAKSFFIIDLMMHIALGWDYRGRRVSQGVVVYCAFEGQTGVETRLEAFRQKFLEDDPEHAPDFFLQPIRIDLVRDHTQLIAAISRQSPDAPVCVVLDTLNRSFSGSESSSHDMAEYISAADVIRDHFQCLVLVVHHCGVEGARPRGHSSLTGAADMQISVKRDPSGCVIATVEYNKDGASGEVLASELEVVEIGVDDEGEVITSCVVVEADVAKRPARSARVLTAKQASILEILQDAGEDGLSIEEWNDRAREIGIGVRRKADLVEIRKALLAKEYVIEIDGSWVAID